MLRRRCCVVKMHFCTKCIFANTILKKKANILLYKMYAKKKWCTIFCAKMYLYRGAKCDCSFFRFALFFTKSKFLLRKNQVFRRKTKTPNKGSAKMYFCIRKAKFLHSKQSGKFVKSKRLLFLLFLQAIQNRRSKKD